jgi:hypothetical protein
MNSIRIEDNIDLFRDRFEGPIECPERGGSKKSGRQQMNIDITEAQSHQPPEVDEMEHFIVTRERSLGDGLKKGQDFGAVSEVSAGQLPDHVRMDEDDSLAEQLRETRLAPAEMGDPKGGVD